MTRDARTLCVMCAWRETCAKRFDFEKSGLHCPEYTRDVTIKAPDDEPASAAAKEDKRKGGLPAWDDED